MKMENRNPTQAQRIVDYLERHGKITQIDALADLGIMRLASRISELNEQGYKITGKMAKVANRYGEICKVKVYHMEGKPDVDCY